jgi:adenylate cyclase
VPRFRSFRRRLLVAILALVAGAQVVAFTIVARLHRAQAEREMSSQLASAAAQFGRVVAQHTADLARSARGLSFDAGLREALSQTTDSRTLQSGLDSFRSRVGAPLVALLSLDGRVLAETRPGASAEPVYAPLFRAADQSESARATGYGVIDDALYSIAVVPLRAPDVVAWIAIGFRLDQPFVEELKQSTGVEITIRREHRVFATTVARRADFVTVRQRLPATTGGPVEVDLQYSRDEKLAPARHLEQVLGLVFAGSLLVASLLALGIARGLSHPVRRLAEHTRLIATGDYSARIRLERDDELGRLADAFNDMAAGLAERDRVRDLLDKNVSPEVAAQLLRDGAALGGEEREVTVLFADLRGFTTLSEKLKPPELLALLNRYLDRMSGEIEHRGGVIDKFIGDAIMALFGAPLTQPDSARRAVDAAVAMERSLAALNHELAAENGPPLAVGIGINTARVIAGNIGSHRRLNYSVVGDGVNVAARLQSLTRTSEYRTNIIVSAATRQALGPEARLVPRPLGKVHVKGRAVAVEIFAVGTEETAADPKPTG